MLVPLGSDLKADAAEMAHRLGWCYVSCLAVVDGQAGAKCEPHPDAAYTMLHAALAFAQQVAARLRAKHDDRVAWLDALYRLPDTRG